MQAIVLGRRDYRENDQMISLLTAEKGKISALAKGVKKITSKNSACLEPFFLVEAEVMPGKNVRHLIKAVGINIFAGIRRDLDKSIIAGRASALLDRLLKENESDERLFDLFYRWLEYVDSHPAGRALYYGFLLHVFGFLGFQPQLGKCSVCGKTPPRNRLLQSYFFSPPDGGIICSDCARKSNNEKIFKLSGKDLISWREFLKREIGAWPRKVSPAAERAIRMFIEYHGEKKLAKISEI